MSDTSSIASETPRADKEMEVVVDSHQEPNSITDFRYEQSSTEIIDETTHLDPRVSPKNNAQEDSTESRSLTPIEETGLTEDSDSGATETGTLNFHLDSDATLLIKHHNGSSSFEVLSCSVAAASPIWRKLLYGNESTARPKQGDWVLELRGDEKAMVMLMNIIHYKFNNVPEQPGPEELYEICLLISQYECAHLVYPWARKWACQLKHFVAEPDAFKSCHKVIWIAWTLGDRDLFRDTADALAVSASIDQENDLISVDGTKLKDMILPSGLLELIEQSRSDTIQKMLNGIEAPIRQLSSPNRDPSVKFCRLGKNQTECESMILGSTLPQLMKEGLFPVPTKFTESVKYLKTKLEEMKTVAYVGPEWTPHMSHMMCSLGFRDTVNKCLREMPVPMGSDHSEHLSKQARVSGLAASTDSLKLEAQSSDRFQFKDTWTLPGSRSVARTQVESSSNSTTGSERGSDHVLSADQNGANASKRKETCCRGV